MLLPLSWATPGVGRRAHSARVLRIDNSCKCRHRPYAHKGPPVSCGEYGPQEGTVKGLTPVPSLVVLGACLCVLGMADPALANSSKNSWSWHGVPLATSFPWGGTETYQRDPVEPFTLYGTTVKKYLIEKLGGASGEKVLSRKKGFTVDTCVGALAASAEDPTVTGLPTGEKVGLTTGRVCKRAEEVELKPACVTSCQAACSSAMEQYMKKEKLRSGFDIEARDKDRLVRRCSRDCGYECLKGGRAYDFAIPFRP